MPDDFFKLPRMVLNADSIELSNNLYEGKPVLIFKTTANNERYNIVAVASDRSIDLFVQTAYINAKKAGA